MLVENLGYLYLKYNHPYRENEIKDINQKPMLFDMSDPIVECNPAQTTPNAIHDEILLIKVEHKVKTIIEIILSITGDKSTNRKKL
ncbi:MULTISPECIES: hypothetical protein [Vibrio]|uniref:hypothetical protein n=1 Tax=Vibrio TaxID=662 RepID=UPI000587B04F|nr:MULTISPECIES: hypothetical protein [Vibrio]MDE3898931.1 hypothetical protein [Vibrio sp. CC007]NRF14265.1 hypothetical protein [Vibrio coralliilyticus]QFT37076.1 hypothetical protein FIU99_11570 [Vibrio sp. THAF64]QGM34978.1 hypothetical protein GGC04_11590 [Vibrio sp. THAF191d]QGN70479.1 hypothetical protein GGC03_11590 [Vibrio sp. THAF191c]